MSDDIDLTGIVESQGIQPFQKVPDTGETWKGLGSSLSSVSATTRLARCFSWGCMASISKKTCKGGRSSSSSERRQGVPRRRHLVWARTFLTGPLSLLLVLRFGGSLYETSVVVSVDVLMTRRAIYVETTVTLNAGQAHILLITVRASVSLRAHGGLEARDGFARMGLAGMGFQTRGSKKVPMTRPATLSGFQVPWVRILKVGAIFLSTGSTQLGLGASMQSLGVVGFPTIPHTHNWPRKIPAIW